MPCRRCSRRSTTPARLCSRRIGNGERLGWTTDSTTRQPPGTGSNCRSKRDRPAWHRKAKRRPGSAATMVGLVLHRSPPIRLRPTNRTPTAGAGAPSSQAAETVSGLHRPSGDVADQGYSVSGVASTSQSDLHVDGCGVLRLGHGVLLGWPGRCDGLPAGLTEMTQPTPADRQLRTKILCGPVREHRSPVRPAPPAPLATLVAPAGATARSPVRVRREFLGAGRPFHLELQQLWLRVA